MRAKRSLAVVGLGAGVSLALGSLLALTSDSVTSQNNKAESGTFAAPAHDLVAAKIPAGGNCETATYTEGPFAAAITSPFANFTLGGSGLNQTDRFCLKNNGTQAGQLVMTFTNVADLEVGVCEQSEADAGDTSCTDLAQGELKPILEARFSLDSGGLEAPSLSFSCTTSGFTAFSTVEAGPEVLDPNLDPGEFCRGLLVLREKLSTTDTERLLAQTDKVQWDIVFTLEDVPSV